MTNILGAISLLNFTNDPLREIMTPLTNLLGGFAYVFLALCIAAVIYVNAEGENKIIGVAIWFILFLGICGVVITLSTGFIIAMLLSLIVGVFVYRGFVGKKSNE